MLGTLLLTNARVVVADGVLAPGWVLAERGVIAELGTGSPGEEVVDRCDGAAGEVVDAGGRWLIPGLIDIHVHGALGHEVMDGDPAAIAVMARFYASHGVTSFLATTWTGTTDVTLRALRAVAEAMREPDPYGATLLGAHMEGPYLNPRRCGAQEASIIRPGDRDEMARFLDVGVVRLMTIAPEVPGNLEVIRQGVDRGVTMSAGHTDATYDQLCAAVASGVRHVTHTFNAMRPLHHREPGTVGAAMTLAELTVELIADGIHVHPAAMRALFAARGAEAMVLVTDAIRAAGMPPGTYPIGDRTVVVADGAVRLPDGALAGSVLTLDRALRNLWSATGAPLEVLWPTASRNAARVIGVDDRKGEIGIGRDADLVLLDEQLEVELTIVGGRIVHRATEEPERGGERPPEETTDRPRLSSV
ncbi:MAG: N-acetylglucosamine-6-phosphate deacetylase [Nitriliruptoraceae bacterium]